jgi:hypothetical protein
MDTIQYLSSLQGLDRQTANSRAEELSPTSADLASKHVFTEAKVSTTFLQISDIVANVDRAFEEELPEI